MIDKNSPIPVYYQLKNDLIKKIENKYPLNLAYDWDNVGLLVGDFDNKTSNWRISSRRYLS